MNHTEKVTVPVLLFACCATLTVAQTSGGKGDPEAAKIKNPVAAMPESLTAGEKTYQSACASCHGKDAKGGIVLSVIEDRGGNQPPDLIDDKWDHGSSDGEIYTVIKKGIGPDFFMAPFDGRITDTEMWNVVNYLRSIAAPPKKEANERLRVSHASGAGPGAPASARVGGSGGAKPPGNE